MTKIVRKLRIKNPSGLHTRPATAIVKLLRTAQSSASFTYNKETVNAKSVMSLLMLAATQHALITVEMEGEDAEEVMHRLSDLFENRFGE